MQNLKVEVQGATFHSEEVRKVMIKIYQPVTIIQTDKPIYLPGQTGNFKLMSLIIKVSIKDAPVSVLTCVFLDGSTVFIVSPSLYLSMCWYWFQIPMKHN